MKKSLLLINPKIVNYPDFLFFPPISLGIIAAYTPDDWEVTLLDENTEALEVKHYDLVGITTSHHFLRAYQIAAYFREIGVPVVLGGLHSSAVPDEAEEHADSVVIGDVEVVWRELLRDTETGVLKRRYNGDNKEQQFIKPLTQFFRGNYFAYTLETSRGCFNHCLFCGLHIPTHRPYRRKPIETVIAELSDTTNPFVFIVDNNFYGRDEEYMFRLFDEMDKHGIRKSFFAGVSIDFFKNEKLVKRASECGLRMVFVGFEADTEESLKALNKKNYNNPTDIFNEYRNIVKLAHRNRILISGKIIIGMPDDTIEKIENRVSFFKRLKLDEVSCAILTPLPMSRLFIQYRNNGELLYNNFPEDWLKYDYNNLAFRHRNLDKAYIDQKQSEINILQKPSLKSCLKALMITRSFEGTFLYYAYAHYFFNFTSRMLEKYFRCWGKSRNLRFPRSQYTGNY
ncbi:MAG TPA: radical SAM protein [Bacteroidales bacterium]|nr:radical SAM protein [Bacteroidales bacterium]